MILDTKLLNSSYVKIHYKEQRVHLYSHRSRPRGRPTAEKVPQLPSLLTDRRREHSHLCLVSVVLLQSTWRGNNKWNIKTIPEASLWHCKFYFQKWMPKCQCLDSSNKIVHHNVSLVVISISKSYNVRLHADLWDCTPELTLCPRC